MARFAHPYGRRRPAWLSVIFIVCVAFLLWAAQDNLGRGRITGQVVDDAGAPVEAAKVVAVSLQGNAKLEGMTDKKGHFAIVGLGTGAWRITTSKQGYSDGIMDMEVSQLKSNPSVTMRIKKITGAQGLWADKVSQDLLDRANGLIDQGNYDAAIALLQDFQTKYPDIYQVRLNIAIAFMKKGETEKAEAEFNGVLEKIQQVHGDYNKDKVTAVKALTGLGEIALKKGEMDSGQAYFSKALALSPDDEVAAYNVGEILFSSQKVDEAVNYFELAIKIRKDWPTPYQKLGFVYLNKGEYTKSLEYFNKFVALDPANPEIPTVKNIIATIEKMKK